MGRQIGETLKKKRRAALGQAAPPGDPDGCFRSDEYGYGPLLCLLWRDRRPGLGHSETAIAQADIVQTYLGYCQQQPIARLCGKYGKMLCVDANYADVQDRKEALAVLPGIDYLKVNEQEAACLSGCEDAEAALSFLGSRTKCGVIVTWEAGAASPWIIGSVMRSRR